jgi:hypothetical protein
MICRRLADEGIAYLPEKPGWTRSKVHNILRDRSYIGDLRYQDQWLPGPHPPIIDHQTFARVQALLGDRIYKANELLYASGLIRCGHCGNLVTGEAVTKKDTGKTYVYYRCTLYNQPGHPRIRLRESQIDQSVMKVFNKIRQPDAVRDWFAGRLRVLGQASAAIIPTGPRSH